MSYQVGCIVVYGVNNLRIIDASVMPQIPTGNIEIPVILSNFFGLGPSFMYPELTTDFLLKSQTYKKWILKKKVNF